MKNILKTLILFSVLTSGLLILGIIIKPESFGFFSARSEYIYGYQQFVLTFPRRVVFLLWALSFASFWMPLEGLRYEKKIHLRKMMLCYAAGFLICFFVSNIQILKMLWLNARFLHIPTCFHISLLPVILLSSGIGAFMEELIFRKILLESFEKNTASFMIANTMQSLLFALLHLLNPMANFQRFVFWFAFAFMQGIIQKAFSRISLVSGIHSGYHLSNIPSLLLQ